MSEPKKKRNRKRKPGSIRDTAEQLGMNYETYRRDLIKINKWKETEEGKQALLATAPRLASPEVFAGLLSEFLNCHSVTDKKGLA